MKNLFSLSLVLTGLALSSTANASGYALVSNGNDSGAGSLRAALAQGATTIGISKSVSTISITETLDFDSASQLRIIGTGQTIDASSIVGNGDILSINEGASLSISNLSFIGNAASVNEDPTTPTGGKGIFVNVPVTQTETVKVYLDKVDVARVGNHGIHISDCTLQDECGGGSGGGGEGSIASVYVNLQDVSVNTVGFGQQDADGVRVDERGDGSIFFVANNSNFLNVGADGVELDEGNNGDVITDVNNSLFDSNGEYCNLIPFIIGGPCDDDGDADVDDGFDIDEAGAGKLYARVRNTKVINNFDEGLDFDEEDEGDIIIAVSDVLALGNADEGIKASEEDEGGVKAYLSNITVVDNNSDGEGIELEEESAGNVVVVVKDSNAIGADDEALQVQQEDEGTGTLKIINSNFPALDLEGVDQI